MPESLHLWYPEGAVQPYQEKARALLPTNPPRNLFLEPSGDFRCSSNANMVLQGITARPARVDFITDCYRIVGTVWITTSGVIGLINDPTNSLIEIQDAQMASLLNPGHLARHFKSACLVKARIVACCMGRREDLGARSLVPRGYTRYAEVPLYFNVGSYDVNATLQWSGRVDFAAILSEPTQDFIPAFNAAVTSLSIQDMSIECPAILMNRRAISMMALQEKN